MILDLHTHNYRCGHAKGRLEEYVIQAIKMDFDYLGFSDHAPLLNQEADQPAPGMHMAKSELNSYYEEAIRLKEKYSNKINLLIGIEIDYFDGFTDEYLNYINKYRFDYIIGSVHYFNDYHVFDPERWENTNNQLDEITKYYSLIKKLIKADMIDVLAHIDAIKALNIEKYRYDISDEILGLVLEYDLTLEINTSGFKKCEQLFPHPEIIKRANEKGITFTYGSDAHSPKDIGYGWKKVKAILNKQSIKNLAVFNYRKRKMIEI